MAAEKRKRFRWLRYIAGVLLLIFLILVVLYQPIIFGVAQLVAPFVAKSQNLSIQFKLRGSLFSDLYLEDVHIAPLPANHDFPIERLDAKLVSARYSLLGLIKRDWSNMVELVTVKDVEVVVRPTNAPPPPPPPRSNQPLKPIVVLPQRLDIEHVSVTVKSANDELAIQNFGLQFAQNAVGALTIDRLRIPSFHEWHGIKAGIEHRNQHLYLTGLDLSPFLVVHRADVDLTKAATSQIGLKLDADALNAPLKAGFELHPDNTKTNFAATAHLDSLKLERLQNALQIAAKGAVEDFTAAIDGDLLHPDTWNAKITARASQLAFQTYPIGALNFLVSVREGHGRIDQLSLGDENNRIGASGQFVLPHELDEFVSATRATVGFGGLITAPQSFLAGLGGNVEISGSLSLRDRLAHLETSVLTNRTSFAPAEVGQTRVQVFGAALVPPTNNLFASLRTVANVGVDNVTAAGAHIDRLRVQSGIIEDNVGSALVEVQSGKSNLRLDAGTHLPRDNQPFDLKTILAHAKFHVDSLQDFVSQNVVEGQLNADGDIAWQDLTPSGFAKIEGSELTFRKFIVKLIDVRADTAGNATQLKSCRIAIDERNFFEATGSVDHTAEFPYQFHANLQLPDFGVFDPLLTSFAQLPGVRGRFELKADAKGTRDLASLEAIIAGNGDGFSYRGFQVQDVNLRADVSKAVADLKDARIRLNDRNQLYLQARGELIGANAFSASGGINLEDFAVFDSFLKSLGQPGGMRGRFRTEFTLQGDAKNPLADAKLHGDGGEIFYRGLKISGIRLDGDAANNLARLSRFYLNFDEPNSIEGSGEARLSAPNSYQGDFKINLDNLSEFNAFLKSFNKNASLTGNLKLSVSARGNAQSKLPVADLQMNGSQIRYQSLPIDLLEVTGESDGKQARLTRCHLDLGANNHIDVKADATVADTTRYQAQGDIELKDLRVFNSFVAENGIDPRTSGELITEFKLNGDTSKPLPDGILTVAGNKINFRNLLFQEVTVNASLADQKVDLPICKIVLNDKNFIDIRTNATLTDPYPYQAYAKIKFEDLSVFNPVIRSFGQDLGLAGRFDFELDGRGNLKDAHGHGELHASQIATKAIKDMKADVVADYQGTSAHLSQISVNTPYASLESTLDFSPEWLTIPGFSVKAKGNEVAGRLKIPLDFKPGAKFPIPSDRPLDIHVTGNKISLASFQTGKPQVTGALNLLVDVTENIRNPRVNVQFGADDVRSPLAASFAGIFALFQVQLADRVATINGNVKQADIQPLTVQGRIPIDVGTILDTNKIPEDTPLQLAVKWPDTNLVFVKRISPLVRIIDGRAGIDANVAGTIRKPALAGSVHANINQFKASTDTIPPLSNFRMNVALAQDHIVFSQFNGLAAGGPFGIRGDIDLTKGTNPVFNLAITGKDVLATRSDNVIVRVNFDLAVRGPLSAGEVVGKVSVVNSRFFQDIDILPLNLPGRPAPTPPAVPPSPSVTTPPLRDWKFDISIQTTDAFLVQMNLARGRIIIDLHIGGTGLKPDVSGSVRIENLVATLPFSHLTIQNGTINFAPGANPLNPQLNIVGESQIRDYQVRLRIYGTVDNFQILFDSTPPLPQGDIAILLATGATPEEFSQNPSLLAGRATFILAQQLLTKVFHFKASAEQQSYLDRLQIDIVPGQRVGTQDINARFSLTDRWQIIGDFGQSGQVGARLRYLFRFR